jgi:hypothetical protein
VSEHTFSAMQRRKDERAKWWSEFYSYRLDPDCLCGYPLTPDGPWYQPHFLLGSCTVHEIGNA